MRRAAVIRPVGPPAAQAASSNSHVPAPACTGCPQAGPPHQALQCGAVPAAREGRPAPGTQQQQRHGSASIGGGSGGGSVLALNVRPALPALHNQWVTCSAIPACLTSLRRLCCLPACSSTRPPACPVWLPSAVRLALRVTSSWPLSCSACPPRPALTALLLLLLLQFWNWRGRGATCPSFMSQRVRTT